MESERHNTHNVCGATRKAARRAVGGCSLPGHPGAHPLPPTTADIVTRRSRGNVVWNWQTRWSSPPRARIGLWPWPGRTGSIQHFVSPSCAPGGHNGVHASLFKRPISRTEASCAPQTVHRLMEEASWAGPKAFYTRFHGDAEAFMTAQHVGT